jgi:hypothetical protein
MPGAWRPWAYARFSSMPRSPQPALAARRGQIPGLFEIQIPLLSGRKKSDAAVYCDNRLENIC